MSEQPQHLDQPVHQEHQDNSQISNFSEKIMLWSRYPLLIVYFAMLSIFCLYIWISLKETFHLFTEAAQLNSSTAMLGVLEILDMMMIANLISMVVIGSYSTFVSDLSGLKGKKPSWLKHISSGLLKIKMGTSLVGVTSIHLLKTFLNPMQVSQQEVIWQLIIHGAFLLSSLVLAIIEKLNDPPVDHH